MVLGSIACPFHSKVPRQAQLLLLIKALRKLLTQKKCDKFKDIICWIKQHHDAGTNPPQKPFCSKTKLIQHVVNIDDVAALHIQGFFLLFNSWLLN
jgi:hypothetical protein